MPGPSSSCRAPPPHPTPADLTDFTSALNTCPDLFARRPHLPAPGGAVRSGSAARVGHRTRSPLPAPTAAVGWPGHERVELAANPMLAEYVVRDLNADPILPLPRRELRRRHMLRLRGLPDQPDHGCSRRSRGWCGPVELLVV